MTDNTLIDSLPETIVVKESDVKPKRGRPTTIASRRKSTPVKGKVKGKRNHFTDKEKLNAVCTYAVTNNARRTAEITKIPEGTIRSWKSTDWWQEAMNRVHVEEDESIATDLTHLVNKAVGHINDRLENGDYIYDTKRGEIKRKPMSAKDLAIVTAISIDKKQLLRGKATSRVENVSSEDILKKLGEEFRRFHNSTLIEQNEVETIDEEEPVIEEVWDEEEEVEEEEQLTINEMFSE